MQSIHHRAFCNSIPQLAESSPCYSQALQRVHEISWARASSAEFITELASNAAGLGELSLPAFFFLEHVLAAIRSGQAKCLRTDTL